MPVTFFPVHFLQSYLTTLPLQCWFLPDSELVSFMWEMVASSRCGTEKETKVRNRRPRIRSKFLKVSDCLWIAQVCTTNRKWNYYSWQGFRKFIVDANAWKINQGHILQLHRFNLQYLKAFNLNDLIEDFFIPSSIGLFSLIINIYLDSYMTLSQSIKSHSRY